MLSKKKNQRASEYFTKCFTSLDIRELQIKAILRFHLTPDRMAFIGNISNENDEMKVRRSDHLHAAGKSMKQHSHSEKSVWVFFFPKS